MIKERTKRQVIPWFYLALPVGLLGLLTYLPVINMFWYSATSWDGLDPHKQYVGFNNYTQIFKNPDILHALFNSLYYFGGAIVQILLALFLATVLSYGFRGANFFKGFLVFPFLLNSVAVVLVFRYLLQGPGITSHAGGLDFLLQHLGLGRFVTQWLGNPHIVNFSLAGVSVWRFIGFNIILFIGSIQSINPELFEAAQLDRANRWHQFRYIILPGIRRITALTFILAISGSIAVFEVPFIMLGGANGSSTFVIETVRIAFNGERVGYASALAVLLLGIVLVVTFVQRTIFRDEQVDLV
jgi:raffinose/stachyose/melibiose transport system permease protein